MRRQFLRGVLQPDRHLSVLKLREVRHRDHERNDKVACHGQRGGLARSMRINGEAADDERDPIREPCLNLRDGLQEWAAFGLCPGRPLGAHPALVVIASDSAAPRRSGRRCDLRRRSPAVTPTTPPAVELVGALGCPRQ